MKKNIKFIYFDVGGVLLSWRGSFVSLAKRHKRSHEEIYKVFKKYDNAFCRGGVTGDEIWAHYRRDLQLPSSDDFDYIDFITDSFGIVDVAHELVHELSKSYSIGLLTNLHQGTYERTIAKGQVPSVDYSAIIKSCDVGFVKPEEEIYHIAQRRAGVLPSQIFFIDDYEQNVQAARRLGWKTHHFAEDNPTKSVRAIREKLL